MKRQVIPTSFKVPKRYKRRFILLGAGGFRLEISCRNGKIVFRQWGECHLPIAASWSLDWIQESMEAVREELGA